MRKSHLNLLLTGITALFLLSACSEESSVSQDDKTKGAPENVKISKTNTNDSVMNEPVDFSTLESVDKTVARIRSEKGEAAVVELRRALTFIQSSDPTVGKSWTATYEKMDGKTPNEIINLAKQ